MRKPYVTPTVRKLDRRSDEGKHLLSAMERVDRRRSTRVRVQIPVQVIVRNLDNVESRFETFTLDVNAHGCLLAMERKPDVGQSVRLLNAQASMEQSGRVIRIEHACDGFYPVAIEFDSPAPKLWPVLTPPEDWFNVDP
jgi:hypothetical protein